MNLYFANYNFCRRHGSLKQSNGAGKMETCTPAKYLGLIDRNLTMTELFSIQYYKDQLISDHDRLIPREVIIVKNLTI